MDTLEEKIAQYGEGKAIDLWVDLYYEMQDEYMHLKDEERDLIRDTVKKIRLSRLKRQELSAKAEQVCADIGLYLQSQGKRRVVTETYDILLPSTSKSPDGLIISNKNDL